MATGGGGGAVSTGAGVGGAGARLFFAAWPGRTGPLGGGAGAAGAASHDSGVGVRAGARSRRSSPACRARRWASELRLLSESVRWNGVDISSSLASSCGGVDRSERVAALMNRSSEETADWWRDKTVIKTRHATLAALNK